MTLLNCDHDMTCDHVIKYCTKCDGTVCVKCHREWGTCRLSHWYPTNWYPNYIPSTTIPYVYPNVYPTWTAGGTVTMGDLNATSTNVGTNTISFSTNLGVTPTESPLPACDHYLGEEE